MLMGLLDSIFGNSSKPSGGAPGGPAFTISTSFRPMRLAARSNNSADLLVTLSNISGTPQMCSVVVELPTSMGFDSVGLHKTKELRLGTLDAGAKKDLAISIYSNSQTPAGLYQLKLSVYSHYRDYAHVLNSVSKTLELRVV